MITAQYSKTDQIQKCGSMWWPIQNQLNVCRIFELCPGFIRTCSLELACWYFTVILYFFEQNIFYLLTPLWINRPTLWSSASICLLLWLQQFQCLEFRSGLSCLDGVFLNLNSYFLRPGIKHLYMESYAHQLGLHCLGSRPCCSVQRYPKPNPGLFLMSFCSGPLGQVFFCW